MFKVIRYRSTACWPKAPERQRPEPVGGAILGGAAGAIIGGAVGGGRGAAIGAIVGGATGGQPRPGGYRYYHDACYQQRPDGAWIVVDGSKAGCSWEQRLADKSYPAIRHRGLENVAKLSELLSR
jgi:hypothetical protein